MLLFSFPLLQYTFNQKCLSDLFIVIYYHLQIACWQIFLFRKADAIQNEIYNI